MMQGNGITRLLTVEGLDESLDRVAGNKRLFLLIIVLVVLLSRLPLMAIYEGNLGLSSDVDSLGYAKAAVAMHLKGSYTISRPPGYPLMEALNFALYPLGWWSVQLLNTTLFAIASLIYAQILRIYAFAGRSLIWAAFTFLPMWVVENCSNTEYTICATFMLGSWLQILRGQVLQGGILFGLAMVSRVSQSIIIFPVFMILAFYTKKRITSVFTFGFIVLATAILGWFLPLWLLTGDISFLGAATWEGSLLRRIMGAGYDLQRAFGSQALIVIGAALLLNLDKILRWVWLDRRSHPFFWGSLLNFAMIIYAPHKPGYALLMTPFLFPLFSACTRLIGLRTITIALLSYWLVSIIQIEPKDEKPHILWVAHGKIYQEIRYRVDSYKLATRLIDEAPRHSVVFADERFVDVILLQRRLQQNFQYETHKGGIYLPHRDVWIVKPLQHGSWIGFAQGQNPQVNRRLSLAISLVNSGRKVYYIPRVKRKFDQYPFLLRNAIEWDPLEASSGYTE